MTGFDLAVLLLRLGVGLTFAAHGAQKAFGWWGGPGPEGWARAVRSMGFRPARLFTFASVAAELGGGLLLAAGFLTALAAAVLVAQATVIIFQVYWPKGFFSTHGGIEFALLLLLATIAISLLGPGGASVDAALGLAIGADVAPLLVVVGFVAGAIALAVPRVVATRPLPGRPPGGAA